MTDLAAGLPTADAAELRALAEAVERDHVALAVTEARLTKSMAAVEQFTERATARQRVSTRERDMTRRAVAAEIAVPLRLSDRSVQQRMVDSLTLVEDYPAMLAAWEAGRVARGHVQTVTRAGRHLSSEDRRAFDVRAAMICERTTPGRAEGPLQNLADRLHPRSLTDRHRDARAGRRIDVYPLGDGMSRLIADVPTILGEGIRDRLDQQATALVDAAEQARARVRDLDGRPRAGEEHPAPAFADPPEADPGDLALAADVRTKDQIRADILCDLLLAGQPAHDPTARPDGHGDLGAIRARVQVVVTATTLAGIDEHPADLAEAGPIDAATARELAGDAPGWDRVLTHPVTCQVLATDRYTPTLDLRRRLRARDRHCRFPGCRVPAIRCEHDHTVDWARGGPTCLMNLAGLCQRHHSMKQFTAWTVRQLGDGVLEWTSPTGRVHIDDPPPPVVCFVPDDGSPPPF